MRDALVILAVIIALAGAMRYPFAGLLAWAWFSLMTPHQMAYGGFGLPLNAVIAAGALFSLLINGEFARMRPDRLSVLIVLFAGLLLLSQAFSLKPDATAIYTDRFVKTLFFALLVAQFADTRLRTHAMLWMVVLALGFFAAKGAIFTLATLGQYRVQGVENTILEDNNHLGIALATTLPLMLYLRAEAARPAVRRGMLLLAGGAVLAILGTHSRGGFLALAAFAGLTWLQTRRKAAIAAGLAAAIIPAIAFMPTKWTDRMTTIGAATQDESFMGRVAAWRTNTEFALQNPLTGAGLRAPYEADLITEHIDPALADSALAAHSIYFEILGGAGFAGLAAYLAVLVGALLSARRLRQTATGWRARFAASAQTSLIVFYVGGASVSLEMWDGYWIVIALIAAVARQQAVAGAPRAPNRPEQGSARQGGRLLSPSPAPAPAARWRAAARGRPTISAARKT